MTLNYFPPINAILHTISCIYTKPSLVLNLDPEKQTSRHGSDYTPGSAVQHHNNGHSTATAGMYIMCYNFTLINLVP